MGDRVNGAFVFTIHAPIRPRVIIMIGMSLIASGSISRLLDKGIIHLIDLPVEIDITPNKIVGEMILICSLMLINGLESIGPHITTTLNRIE